MKIIVFDLDETLGYFTQFGIFWDSLVTYLKNNKQRELTQTDFHLILDLFPEFLRPNIINILNYLKRKKMKNSCNKIMIYTNNSGPPEWTQYIVSYFEEKNNFKLIDQIIAAFKINGKRVEICRTSHNKSHKDLIKCTKIPLDTEICFIDDNFYPDMTHDNIYYINIKPYYHDLKFEYMISKFKHSELGKQLIEQHNNEFDRLIMENISLYNYSVVLKDEKEYEIDKILSKEILIHLQNFFNRSIKNKTIKNKIYKRNITFKKRKCDK